MLATMRRRFTNISDNRVLGILLLLFSFAVGVSVGAHFASREVNLWQWLDGFAQNFGTEMFGAFLTFLLIEVLVGDRRKREDEERTIEKRKEQLLRQIGSQVNEEAIRAAEELRAAGWLTEGSLLGADLGSANLQAVNLKGASLQTVDLTYANLQDANLRDVNLQAANLTNANLKGANLSNGNLQEANLTGANLQRTMLSGANLEGVKLLGANLAKIHSYFGSISSEEEVSSFERKIVTRVNENSTLPDGSHWTSVTDMKRFTDPEHPDFWRAGEDDLFTPSWSKKMPKKGDNQEDND